MAGATGRPARALAAGLAGAAGAAASPLCPQPLERPPIRFRRVTARTPRQITAVRSPLRTRRRSHRRSRLHTRRRSRHRRLPEVHLLPPGACSLASLLRDHPKILHRHHDARHPPDVCRYATHRAKIIKILFLFYIYMYDMRQGLEPPLPAHRSRVERRAVYRAVTTSGRSVVSRVRHYASIPVVGCTVVWHVLEQDLESSR